LEIITGDSEGGQAGDIKVKAGRSGATEGGDRSMGAGVQLSSGQGEAQGGGVNIDAGRGGRVGGDVQIQPGTGGETDGSVVISTAAGNRAMEVGADGQVGITGTQGSDVVVKTGRNTDVVLEDAQEFRIVDGSAAESENAVKLRISNERLISHVGIQATSITYPSDSRIKKDLSDVDEDDVLQRLQKIKMQSYGYTDEWRKVRGISDTRVRGVIAQQLQKEFPEYVNVIDKLEFKDKEFKLEQFHEVNKQALMMDTLAGSHSLSASTTPSPLYMCILRTLEEAAPQPKYTN
jgi:hypothetical protein